MHRKLAVTARTLEIDLSILLLATCNVSCRPRGKKQAYRPKERVAERDLVFDLSEAYLIWGPDKCTNDQSFTRV